MKYMMIVVAAGFLLSFASPLSAAVFQRDWKTPGDGLLTYDDVNQREWLDLSETLLNQFAGTTLEEKYQSVRTQLAPGGVFEGFVVGKRLDVTAFAESTGIDSSIDVFDTNASSTLNLIGLLSATRIHSNGHRQSRGFIDEASIMTTNSVRRVEAIIDYFPPQPSYVGDAGLYIFAGDDNQSATATGVMLFRNAVPEPSTWSISVCALIVVGSILRSKRTNVEQCLTR